MENIQESLKIPANKCHLVAMPYPGRGHINPMLNLCKLILSKSNDIFITFVVTQEWLGFLGSELKLRPANFQLAAIPQVVPSEVGRAANMGEFIKAILTKLQDPFERLLDRLELKPKAIIYDVFLSWVVSVGNQRGIPVASLVTVSASFYTIVSHFELLVQHGHVPLEVSDHTPRCVPDRKNEILGYIPGLPSVTFADLPPSFQQDGKNLLNQMLNMVPATKNSQYLLIASIYEFEEQAINGLKSKFPTPLYTIGPMIPYLTLSSEDKIRHENYFQWLDSQPKGSVLYISQGSYLSLSIDQLQEMKAGILDSKIRFLWVTRDETFGFKNGISDNEMGFFVPWCDQLRVLCHSSVGGFWTHCGWNSSLEGFYAGVPMITCPLSWDQFLHSRMIVKDLKTGLRVIEDHQFESGELVKREEIAEFVRKFMESDNGERKEMVRRANELGDTFRNATINGGSAFSDLEAFVNNILLL